MKAQLKIPDNSFQTIATMVLKITVASNVEGWDIVRNEQLIKALTRDE